MAAILTNEIPNKRMVKKIITILIIFIIEVNSYGQNIKIIKATLDKRVVREYSGQAQVDGIIDIEFEINNSTKDTLYLFNRLVEPFIAEKPFKVTQTQTSIEKFSKDCGGVFIYNQPPSSYRYEKFDKDNDIIKIAPKAKKKLSLTRIVEEGLCPLNGKKIEICITYKQELSEFNSENYQKQIVQNETALKILRAHKELYEKTEVLKEKENLLKEINRTIEDLESDNKYASARIKDYEYIKKLPLYDKEIKSNCVSVNE